MEAITFRRAKVWSFAAVFALTLSAWAQSFHDVAPSGEIEVRGRIERTSVPDVYSIGGKFFKFAQATPVDGFAFDEQSREFFVGKDVHAVLKAGSGKSPTELVAVMPNHLYSSEPFMLSREQVELFRQSGIESGRFKGAAQSPAYQSAENFRVTLRESRPVVPGETAMILTFSGAQGIDPGAVMGHFAFGQAVVQEDRTLKGEISNFYPVVNRKGVIPGNVPLTDYFGHLTAGQAQYRPTFTLIVYGVDPEQLKEARRQMSEVFDYLKKNLDFKFSSNFNCATESCLVLKKAGAEVNKSNPDSVVQAVSDAILRALDVREHQTNSFKRLMYILLRDGAAFLPKTSFERSLQNILRDGRIGGEKIARVDYVFQGQIPSARPRGGLAPGNLIEYVKILPGVKPKGPDAPMACGKVF